MKKKKIIIHFVILMLIISFTSSTYAIFGLDNIFETGKKWTNKDISLTGQNEVYDETNRIAGILWIIGLFAFIIIGATLGIKYMFAASSDEKAEIKKSLTPLLVGGGIVFGALTIWQIMLKFFDNII